jgi:ribosomal protein L16 Arg81 hydroxylase
MLEHALASSEADVLIVRRGKTLERPPPRSLAEVKTLFHDDAGIALRRAEQASEPVKELASALSQDVPGELRVIVFATPGDTHGFGWHFDTEEVFIFQTAGSKTYYLRANTVLPATAEPCEASFAAYASEKSPLMACKLHEGDFLYVPRCWWHVAIAHQASLSVSIGVLP